MAIVSVRGCAGTVAGHIRAEGEQTPSAIGVTGDSSKPIAALADRTSRPTCCRAGRPSRKVMGWPRRTSRANFAPMGVEPLGDEGTYFQPVVRRGYRVTAAIHGDGHGPWRDAHIRTRRPRVLSGDGRRTSDADVPWRRVRRLWPERPWPVELTWRRAPASGKLVLVPAGACRSDRVGRWARSARLMTRAGASRRVWSHGSSGAAAAIGFSPTPIVRPVTADAAAASRRRRRTGSRRREADAGARGRESATGPDDAPSTFVDRRRPRLSPTRSSSRSCSGRPRAACRPCAQGRQEARRCRRCRWRTWRSRSRSTRDTTWSRPSARRTSCGIVRGSDPVLRDAVRDVRRAPRPRGLCDRAPAAATAASTSQSTKTPSGMAPTTTDRDRRRCWRSRKAFTTGPRPKRSVDLRVARRRRGGSDRVALHGRESGRAARRVQAMFNIDMIGRNRDDEAGQANTVFLIGADRISTDLHNVIVERQRAARAAADPRLRVQRPGRRQQLLHAERPLQLRVQGRAERLLLHGDPRRLPRQHGHGGQDPVPEAGSHHRVHLPRPGTPWPTRRPRSRRDNLGPRAGRGFSGLLASARPCRQRSDGWPALSL